MAESRIDEQRSETDDVIDADEPVELMIEVHVPTIAPRRSCREP